MYPNVAMPSFAYRSMVVDSASRARRSNIVTFGRMDASCRMEDAVDVAMDIADTVADYEVPCLLVISPKEVPREGEGG